MVNNKSVPLVQTEDRNINQLQQNIIPSLNKLLGNPILNNNDLSHIQLAIGSNSINHLLGRPLIGWQITRQRSLANIYDNQDNNAKPEQTLILVSDAVVSVDLRVF